MMRKLSQTMLLLPLLVCCVHGASPSTTRRGLAVRVGGGLGGILSAPGACGAFPTIAEVFPPKLPSTIPRVPRQRIEGDFAVLLMRSGYNAVDDLDFVPMDEFQKRFFLLRQAAWQDYRELADSQLGMAPLQGELADPLYFDFISYAQYATINLFLKSPRAIFEELTGAEGDSTVVARDNGIQDADLATEHSKKVGDAMLDFILTRYGGIDLEGPVDILENVRRLLGWLVALGFAIDSSCSLKQQTITCTLVGPANLWGLQAIGQGLQNDFVGKLIASYLSRLGFQSSAKLKTDASSSTHTIRIRY